MNGITPKAIRAAVKVIVDAMSERDDVVSCAANAVVALRDLGWGPVSAPVRPTVQALVEVLTSAQHAPMETHDPRSGECLVCPVPLHLLSPEEIASALLAADHLWTEPAWEYGLAFRSHMQQTKWPAQATVMDRETAEHHASYSFGVTGQVVVRRRAAVPAGEWEMLPSGSVPTETEGNKG